jgi:hypothetical protein
MTSEFEPHDTPDLADLLSGDMLSRVRKLDPMADAKAVRRYACEIAEADTVLQALDLDLSTAPLDVAFSPDWNDGLTP